MTDSLWTVIKLVARSFEPQWMFRRRLTRVMQGKADDCFLRMGVNINVRDFFGKEVNNTKEWKRLVNAHRELIEAMMGVGADIEPLQRSMADVINALADGPQMVPMSEQGLTMLAMPAQVLGREWREEWCL